jgi:hypothetical protein
MMTVMFRLLHYIKIWVYKMHISNTLTHHKLLNTLVVCFFISYCRLFVSEAHSNGSDNFILVQSAVFPKLKKTWLLNWQRPKYAVWASSFSSFQLYAVEVLSQDPRRQLSVAPEVTPAQVQPPPHHPHSRLYSCPYYGISYATRVPAGIFRLRPKLNNRAFQNSNIINNIYVTIT